MPIALALATFIQRSAQCDSLIANAHKVDVHGAALFPTLDRQQITVAVFLNLFVAWEEFLETTLTNFMAGAPTLSGTQPVRFAVPSTVGMARAMVIGMNRYFDYANHEYVRRAVSMYLENGYPFEPHIGSILSNLADLRTMRNASAHLSSTTQMSLESLAQRIIGTPQPGIDLYALLTHIDPKSAFGNTVFAEHRDTLLAAAHMISTG